MTAREVANRIVGYGGQVAMPIQIVSLITPLRFLRGVCFEIRIVTADELNTGVKLR